MDTIIAFARLYITIVHAITYKFNGRGKFKLFLFVLFIYNSVSQLLLENCFITKLFVFHDYCIKVFYNAIKLFMKKIQF